MITEKDIIDAYVRIRTIDNKIPDEILDFMKEASIKQLLIQRVVVPKGTLSCGCEDHLTITFTSEGDYCGNCGKIIPTT